MKKSLFVWLLLITLGNNVMAQRKISVDLKLGSEYAYAEGAHFGLGNRPLKGHYFIMKFYPSLLLHYQINDKTSISTGYSGGAAGYGYGIKIPDDISHNEFGGAWSKSATAIYVDRIPFILEQQIKSFDFKPVTSTNDIHVYSIKLNITGGLGLVRVHDFSPNHFGFGGVFLQDTIGGKESDPQIINRWGGYATAGATARFYRLGKERLNVSLFVNQGFTDLLHTQLDYTYNSRKGSQLFRSRSSGIGFTVGIPILLKTIEPKTTTTTQ